MKNYWAFPIYQNSDSSCEQTVVGNDVAYWSGRSLRVLQFLSDHPNRNQRFSWTLPWMKVIESG